MSKLLRRLSDASRSGVYRAPRVDEVLDATRGSALRVARITLADASGKSALMAQFASALEFPQWFGANWDALEDCLSDLSWTGARGHVLLIEGAGALSNDDRGVLADILASAAAYWAERTRPFFAVFVGGAPPLPELYREKK